MVFFFAESLRLKHLHLASLPLSILSLGKLELISNEEMPLHPYRVRSPEPRPLKHLREVFPSICLELQFNSLHLLPYCALRYSEFIQQSSCFEDNYYRTQPDVK